MAVLEEETYSWLGSVSRMATQNLAGEDGVLNGTTPVTVITAPTGADQIGNKLITIHNGDTAVVTVTLNKVSAGGTRQLWSGDLDVGDTLLFDDVLILDATTDSVTAVMSAAAATTDPDFTSSYIVNTP